MKKIINLPFCRYFFIAPVVFLMGAILSTTAIAMIPIGELAGFTQFFKAGKEHYSPIIGAASLDFFQSIRIYGPYKQVFKDG